MSRIPKLAVVAALLGSALALQGCLPLAATGVAVGALAALDRRTVGAQTEDTEIELKVRNRLGADLSGTASGGVSVTSFNRRVLLTGQVPDEQSRRDAERLAAGVVGVRQVHNELTVAPRAALSAESSDALLTARVKASYVEQRSLNSTAVKVVTEGGTVYLMGLLTEREAPTYAQVASRVSGVRRVVTLFEFITEEELQRLTSRQ